MNHADVKTTATFALSPENLEKAHIYISRYPEGRQASAVIPVLHLAQNQNDGWLPRAAIEYVARLLDMPLMRVYEVATFYTMFNLKPVGKYFIQVCTTTPCWLQGAYDILEACRHHLGADKGAITEDELFSFTEVECLGACANAPMAQINEDYYEDLTPQSLIGIIEALKCGQPVKAGSQIGRRSSEPFAREEESSSDGGASAQENLSDSQEGSPC